MEIIKPEHRHDGQTRLSTPPFPHPPADRAVEEYRTRLIADVVTGKLDVREAAARLPDEPEDAR